MSSGASSPSSASSFSSFPIISLSYKIHGYSSYADPFYPDRVLMNDPNDAQSRWTSNTNDSNQYLEIALDSTSIVRQIYFGKYCMPHVCNVSKLKLEASLDGRVFWSLGSIWPLHNDNVGELFLLPTQACQISFDKSSKNSEMDFEIPCKYIRIRPLETWGSSFNFCIWFVDLLGINDDSYVQKNENLLSKWKTHQTKLLIEKFSRRMEGQTINSSLQLEHPLVTEFRNTILSRTDGGCLEWKRIESLVHQAGSQGMLDQKRQDLSCQLKWNLLSPFEDISHVNIPKKPCGRAGHQLVIDEKTGDFYIFGGFDGSRELEDFWIYSQKKNSWREIPRSKTDIPWPSPRSVHRMIYDSDRNGFYLFGRYMEMVPTIPGNLTNSDGSIPTCDLWFYSIDSGKWARLCENTEIMGGPPPCYDAQLAIDTKRRWLLIHGGKRILPKGNGASSLFAGFYIYNLDDGTWRQPITGISNTTDIDPIQDGRVGHSFLIDSSREQAWIIGGQRHKGLLTDIISFNYVTGSLIYSQPDFFSCLGETKNLVSRDVSTHNGILKAAIDTQFKKLFIIYKSTTDKKSSTNTLMENTYDPSRATSLESALTIYQTSYDQMAEESCFLAYMPLSQWKMIPLVTEKDNVLSKNGATQVIPAIRIAFTLTYNSLRKEFVLFGGNTDKNDCGRRSEDGTLGNILRLNDLWTASILITDSAKWGRKISYEIRKYAFIEKVWKVKEHIEKQQLLNADQDSLLRGALHFLHNELHDVINENDPEELADFTAMPQLLLQAANHQLDPQALEASAPSRQYLLDYVLNLLPIGLQEPLKDLENYVLL